MNRIALSVMAVAFAMGGCATKDYVHEYVGGQVTPVAKRVDGVEGRSAANEAGIQALNKRADGADATLNRHAGMLSDHSGRIETASRTAQEALDRATAAGRLAEGRLLYEVAMTDDTLRFNLEGAELSKPAMQVLSDFADKLKAENRNVYIEIQGHTDNKGSPAFNLKLGEARAEAVRRFLNIKGGIPLHRLSVISYGEAAPAADNKTLAGRKANRRVVLVVLK